MTTTEDRSQLVGQGNSSAELRHNLSKTLQNPSVSASEGIVIVELTRKTLVSLHTDANFDMFW